METKCLNWPYINNSSRKSSDLMNEQILPVLQALEDKFYLKLTVNYTNRKKKYIMLSNMLMIFIFQIILKIMLLFFFT